jgi:hypothetical protein
MAEKKKDDKPQALPAPKEGETPSAYAARVAKGDPDVYAEAKEALRRGYIS